MHPADAAPPPLDPPPVSPPPKPRFYLPKAAWIVWGAFVVLRFVLVFRSTDPLTPYAWGNLLGQTVGLLVFPTVVAWVVWLISGRRAMAGHVTFFVVFALSLFGQLSQLAPRRAETQATLNHLNEEARQLRTSGDADPAKATAFLESTAQKLGAASAGASAQDRASLEAVQAFTQKFAGTSRVYDAAIQGLGLDTFFDFTHLDTVEKIAARRTAVGEFRTASANLRVLQADGEAVFRAELEQRKVPAATVAQSLEGYRSSAAAQLPVVLKIRDLEADYAVTLLEFLDFAESQIGQWQLADTQLLFNSDAAIERYNALISRLVENEKAQQELQQQAIAAKS